MHRPLLHSRVRANKHWYVRTVWGWDLTHSTLAPRNVQLWHGPGKGSWKYGSVLISRLAIQLPRLWESVPRKTTKAAPKMSQEPTNADTSQSLMCTSLYSSNEVSAP
jgi:hypothetical protein